MWIVAKARYGNFPSQRMHKVTHPASFDQESLNQHLSKRLGIQKAILDLFVKQTTYWAAVNRQPAHKRDFFDAKIGGSSAKSVGELWFG